MGIVATSDNKALLEAIRELAEYRGLDPIATAFNVGNSFYLVNEVWRAADPKTAAEIMAHYRTCEMQVEQQVFATYGIPHEAALRDRMAALVEPGAIVLDFGAGIGSQLLPMLAKSCRCTHVDVGGVMMKYAAWRYRRQSKFGWNPATDVELVELRDDYIKDHVAVGVPELRDRTFDVVICTEVIEHVVDPEALAVLLASYVKPGGLLVATTSFHNHDGMVPMHLNVGTYTDEQFASEIFPRYGLTPIEPSVYRKRSSAE
jgi:2-polyprenyl-3-methyl-5-hydroxy-6-metoxy-1,4-benzoquinol methylase